MSNNWTPKQYQDYVNKTKAGSSRKPSKPEQTVCAQPLEKTLIKEGYSGKVKILYTSVARRMLDPDNNRSKFHTDGLRYEGLLRDDTFNDVEITTTARKCQKGEQPHTIIEIIYP